MARRETNGADCTEIINPLHHYIYCIAIASYVLTAGTTLYVNTMHTLSHRAALPQGAAVLTLSMAVEPVRLVVFGSLC